MMSCLPFCATAPVSAMLKPTLMGSAAPAGVRASKAESGVAARPATTVRRVFGMASSLVDLPRACLLICLRGSVMHLVRRHDAPEIRRRRVLGPHFRPLRIVAMPRPRLEIAELLVHAVELGEGLGDHAVRRAVVGEKIVADAVTARAPEQLVAMTAEEVAGRLHVRPVAQLERGVEVAVRAGLHQVDGVMIGAAAQE